MPAKRTRLRRPARDAGPGRARTEMTPMIDVTFLLLIFFMLTIQFRTLEGLLAAHLPGDVGGNPSPTEPRDDVDVRIEVLRAGTRLAADSNRDWPGEGPWRFGPDRLVRWSVGPWSTLDPAALGPRLASVFRHEPDRRVMIDARQGTIHAEAVTAVDAARLAGWSDVGFAVSH